MQDMMLLHHEGILTIGQVLQNMAMLGAAGVALAFRISWHAVGDWIKSAWAVITRKDITDERRNRN